MDRLRIPAEGSSVQIEESWGRFNLVIENRDTLTTIEFHGTSGEVAALMGRIAKALATDDY